MYKAEEIFIIVRELSLARGGYFCWKDFFRAAEAVMWSEARVGKGAFHCTVGNMLRAQHMHRTIARFRRGQYCIIDSEPRRPLYVQAGVHHMTKITSRSLSARSR